MRCILINDKILKKEVKVVYCPTGNIVAEIFTKPLQGSLFKKVRDEIMNVQKNASCSCGVTMLHRSVLRNYNKYSIGQIQLRGICRKSPYPWTCRNISK